MQMSPEEFAHLPSAILVGFIIALTVWIGVARVFTQIVDEVILNTSKRKVKEDTYELFDDAENDE